MAPPTTEEHHKQLHVVMFPLLAFGHMIPFLELSKFIARKGHRVSFISTPRNIQRLPKLQGAETISFVEFPLPKVTPNLPEGAEATTDITIGEEMSLLKRAADGLEPQIASFLESSNPDWVICDFFPHWLPDITKRLKIKYANFSILPAKFHAFGGPPDVSINGTDYRKTVEDFMVPPKWVEIETKLGFRKFEAKWFMACSGVEKNASEASDFYRAGKVLDGCDAILVRDCREFHPEWLTVAEGLFKKPVIPIGLMPPRVVPEEDDTEYHDKDDEWFKVKSWLDGYGKESVVYVALGSEVALTQHQLTELAIGLELSNAPFFWVQRNTANNTSSLHLPDGFEERVKGRGIVWKTWAPQLKILNHGSVGGFLTHCGWSSVIEGLAFGRVLICLPFWVDTGLNSRVISEKELGVEIRRNEEDGSFVRYDVAEAVKVAMDGVGEKGVKIREEAKKASLVFGDVGLHDGYLNSMVQFLEAFEKGCS